METRVKNKVETHLTSFKSELLKLIESIESYEIGDKNKLRNLVECYPAPNLTKEDFNKRKRTKNNIPLFDRCMACKQNGTQCTRRRKADLKYCGTHEKGQPYGVITSEKTDLVKPPTKVQITVVEVRGVKYYIDSENNIYEPLDVFDNILNPKVIGKYISSGDGDARVEMY